MAEVSSAAFVFNLRSGAARDPEGQNGTATILNDWTFRGAGQYDNRALNDKLDNLGLHRHGDAGTLTTSFGGTLLGDNLYEALALYADILQRPMLPDDHFEQCRALAQQHLASLEDDPRQRISLLAREEHLPYPYGRPSVGKQNEISEITAESARRFWQETYTPAETILAVAGKVDFEQLKAKAEMLFGNWQGEPLPELPQPARKSGICHKPNEGAQVHVAVMYPSANYQDPNYYSAQAACAVLSGGMGSRLFTEVREKRGLCYAVYASQRVVGPYGCVMGYVGSSPEQAQEALDVMLAEFNRLAEGITEEELQRAQVGMRASLIMTGESSNARAAGCARDFRNLGRVRTLEEIEQAIMALTVDDVVNYVKANPPRDYTITTIGPKELAI